MIPPVAAVARLAGRPVFLASVGMIIGLKQPLLCSLFNFRHYWERWVFDRPAELVRFHKQFTNTRLKWLTDLAAGRFRGHISRKGSL